MGREVGREERGDFPASSGKPKLSFEKQPDLLVSWAPMSLPAVRIPCLPHLYQVGPSLENILSHPHLSTQPSLWIFMRTFLLENPVVASN